MKHKESTTLSDLHPRLCTGQCFSILTAHLNGVCATCDDCCLTQFWELYLGLRRTEARSGCFGEVLNCVFINILCIIRQLHVESKARCSCFAGHPNKTDFPHYGPGDPKLHHQNLRWELGSIAPTWTSGWAEEIPISFSCSWTAEGIAGFCVLVPSLLTIAFCPWFLFKFASHVCIIFNWSEFVTPHQSCCGFSKKEQRQKEGSHTAELNATELTWNQFACDTVWHFNKTVVNSYHFIFIVLRMGIQRPENSIFIAPGELGQ